jgi:hypothetical protein
LLTERLLQYIWQFQHYNKRDLLLSGGEQLSVLHPGLFNTNQGPDFLESRIKIGDTTWIGHVELHIKTSDWYKHNHQADRNYDNVVLHVVWDDDRPQRLQTAPVLALGERVPKLLLQQYSAWMKSPFFIPCGTQAALAADIVWLNWKERLLVERLQRKSAIIFSCLQQNHGHWEETFWWLLARNFGIKVNADAFEAIARSLPVTWLAKHKNQLHQLEALLLGQAGLLEGAFTDHYPLMLKKEYAFYKVKYKLNPIREAVHFLRMRPSSFPTVRLAQLAMLIYECSHLFAQIKEMTDIVQVRNLFSVVANDFWHYHYTFEELSAYRPKRLGKQMIDNIIINTVAPALFAYGHWHKEEQYKERALQWLQAIAAESNTITAGFIQLGVPNKNALDSQAFIELKTNYCDKKKCLDCAVGNALLKRSVVAEGSL